MNDYWIKKLTSMINLYDTNEIANMRYQLYKSYVVCSINDNKDLEKIEPLLENYLAKKIEEK